MRNTGPSERLVVALTVAALCVAAPAARADDPDWPCAQPFVPMVSAAAYWDVVPVAPAEAPADPRVADLAAAAASRDEPVEAVQARLAAFARSVPPVLRPAVLTQTFARLVDAVNGERSRLLTRIRHLARRQRELSRMATGLAAELRDTPPDAPAAAELAQRRDGATRVFQETQRTMRYACEAPASLEARLGRFARTLRAALDD